MQSKTNLKFNIVCAFVAFALVLSSAFNVALAPCTAVNAKAFADVRKTDVIADSTVDALGLTVAN